MITEFKLFEDKGEKFEIGDIVKVKRKRFKKQYFVIARNGNWNNYLLEDNIENIGWCYDFQIRHLTKQEELEY